MAPDCSSVSVSLSVEDEEDWLVFGGCGFASVCPTFCVQEGCCSTPSAAAELRDGEMFKKKGDEIEDKTCCLR